MNKVLEKLLFYHQDERVQQEHVNSLAVAGIIVLYISLFDFLVRGVFLNKPIGEWFMTLIVIVIFSGFYFVQLVCRESVYVIKTKNWFNNLIILVITGVLTFKNGAVSIEKIMKLDISLIYAFVLLIKFFVLFFIFKLIRSLIMKLIKKYEIE